jgi:hypothetical protein
MTLPRCFPLPYVLAHVRDVRLLRAIARFSKRTSRVLV